MPEDLRPQLESWLDDLPGGAFLPPVGLEQRARRRHRRRQGLALAGTAVATAAAVLTVSALTGNDRPAPSRPAVPEPVVPSSLQTVQFYGVAMDVPAAWRIGATECGTPVADTVVLENGGGSLLCLFTTRKRSTVVRMSHWSGARLPFPLVAASQHDRPVLRGRGAFPGRPEVAVVVLPDLGVVVSVESPDLDEAQHLLESVRGGDLDERDCKRRVYAYTPVGDVGLGARGQLVGGTVETATACEYDDLRLTGSRALDGQQAQALAAAFNASPSGRTPATGAACTSRQGHGWVVRFHRTDGAVAEVFVRDEPCRVGFASSGAVQTQVTPEVLALLRR